MTRVISPIISQRAYAPLYDILWSEGALYMGMLGRYLLCIDIQIYIYTCTYCMCIYKHQCVCIHTGSMHTYIYMYIDVLYVYVYMYLGIWNLKVWDSMLPWMIEILHDLR